MPFDCVLGIVRDIRNARIPTTRKLIITVISPVVYVVVIIVALLSRVVRIAPFGALAAVFVEFQKRHRYTKRVHASVCHSLWACV